jgi:ABC-type bacteriocin/lantibiotic exporter with double-glycine peptidase domain/glycosyltransferase involved in cell wall biosynthesis
VATPASHGRLKVAEALTVVIPAWGERYAGPLLDEAIDSLLAEEPELRLVIVDNASERPWPSRPRVEVVRSSSRLTLGAARNLGLQAVRTPLVMFWDADDLMPPGTLTALCRAMEDPEVVVAAARIVEFDGRPHHWPRRWTGRLARAPRVFASVHAISSLFPAIGGAVVRTAAVRDAGGFSDADGVEDWVLGVSLAFRGRIVLCDHFGRRYRRDAASMSAAWRVPDFLAHARYVRRRLRADPAVPRPLRALSPLFALPQWGVILLLRPVRLLAAWLRRRGRSGPRLGARERLRMLARLMAGTRRMLLLSTLAAALQAALLLPVVKIVTDVFDHRIPHRDTGGILLDGAAIVALYLAATAVALLARPPVVREMKARVAALRADVAATIQGMPRSWQDRQRMGDLHSLVVFDTENVDRMAAQLAYPLIPALLVAAALSVVALVLDPTLFVVVLLTVPPLMAVTSRLGIRTRRHAAVHNDALRRFSGRAQVALRAAVLTKAQGAEEWVAAGQTRDALGLAETGRRLALAQGMHTLAQGAVSAVAGAAVLVTGGFAVVDGRMSLGELLAFYAVVGLLLRQLALAMPGFATLPVGLESLARIEALLAEREHVPDPYSGTGDPCFGGAVRLEGVVFAYSDQPVLRGVDLTIAPGDHVGLVGPNGSGKTTLAMIVCGLYRPQGGRVYAGELPFDEIDMAAFRRGVGVVLQDPMLFAGSIRENVAFGRPDATEEEVWEAIDAAGARRFVEAMPAGLDSQVGDEGALMSGGQRQRIAIARALIGRPRLLLLDEPTTYLDHDAVATVLANLTRLPWQPTILLITHDAEVARRADRTVELREGRIVEAEPDPHAVANAPAGASTRLRPRRLAS